MRRRTKKNGEAQFIDLGISSRARCPKVDEFCGRYDILRIPCDKEESCFIINQQRALAEEEENLKKENKSHVSKSIPVPDVFGVVDDSVGDHGNDELC